MKLNCSSTCSNQIFILQTKLVSYPRAISSWMTTLGSCHCEMVEHLTLTVSSIEINDRYRSSFLQIVPLHASGIENYILNDAWTWFLIYGWQQHKGRTFLGKCLLEEQGIQYRRRAWTLYCSFYDFSSMARDATLFLICIPSIHEGFVSIWLHL